MAEKWYSGLPPPEEELTVVQTTLITKSSDFRHTALQKKVETEVGPNVSLSRLTYRVFMIRARSLLQASFIILKYEKKKTIAKSDESKEILKKEKK